MEGNEKGDIPGKILVDGGLRPSVEELKLILITNIMDSDFEKDSIGINGILRILWKEDKYFMNKCRKCYNLHSISNILIHAH